MVKHNKKYGYLIVSKQVQDMKVYDNGIYPHSTIEGVDHISVLDKIDIG